ncbi:glycosyltransferase [Lacinutrix salivirga]
MRKGDNVTRDKLLELEACSHRVIIPLYIPNEKDYYENAFNIFKMCVLSVQKTAQSPLKISVISNGSCDSVHEKLFGLQQQNHIHELIIVKENIGKINSILKALRTANERLITITDGDVLFVNGWEQAVVNVFKAFPKAGMVSPVPVFRTQLRLTSNIWRRYLFSSQLKFRPVKNVEALTRFANSIGWRRLNANYKDVFATLKAKDDTIAVIGNSHFVGTYKQEVFSKLPKEQSAYKLGGNSEELYTDTPVLKFGGYRLATYDNYAYHLGNLLEPWMEEQFKSLKTEPKVFNDYQMLNTLKPNSWSYFVSERVFKKLFRLQGFKTFVFKRKGLNKEQIKSLS